MSNYGNRKHVHLYIIHACLSVCGSKREHFVYTHSDGIDERGLPGILKANKRELHFLFVEQTDTQDDQKQRDWTL